VKQLSDGRIRVGSKFQWLSDQAKFRFGSQVSGWSASLVVPAVRCAECNPLVVDLDQDERRSTR